MEILRLNHAKNVFQQECSTIHLKIGDAVIVLEERHGQLVVYSDEVDLTIQTQRSNLFTVTANKS